MKKEVYIYDDGSSDKSPLLAIEDWSWNNIEKIQNGEKWAKAPDDLQLNEWDIQNLMRE